MKTLKIKEGSKKELDTLKHRLKYANYSDLILDMCAYFKHKKIAPKEAILEDVERDNTVTQIQEFREALFKKLGAIERDILRPDKQRLEAIERGLLVPFYNDFNSVSGYIKGQFDGLKSPNSKGIEGVDDSKIESPLSPINSRNELKENANKGFIYILQRFKSSLSKEDNYYKCTDADIEKLLSDYQRMIEKW